MRLLWLPVEFALCGCTTMVTVVPAAMTAAVDELEPGAHISLRTAAGWHEDLRVVEVDAENIRDERGHEPLVIARDDVAEIEVARGAPGKTAAFAAGIYLLSPCRACPPAGG